MSEGERSGQHSPSPLTPTVEHASCVGTPGYFPNVVVTGHDGRRALFYDDLLRGRTVIVNCLALAGDTANPLTANLVEVQRLLGDRVGRDVFMYTLTVDPRHDTPRALERFARRHGVGPGWLFLTGEPGDIDLLRRRLYAGGGHRHSGADCALGLLRYGNEAIGLWGSVPARLEPRWIIQRLRWIEPRQRPAGAPRRRGPLPGGFT